MVPAFITIPQLCILQSSLETSHLRAVIITVVVAFTETIAWISVITAEQVRIKMVVTSNNRDTMDHSPLMPHLGVLLLRVVPTRQITSMAYHLVGTTVNMEAGAIRHMVS